MNDTKIAASSDPAAPPPPSPIGTTKAPRTNGKFPLVYVEWWDHNTHGDWVSDADIDGEPSLVQTAGYLIRDTEMTVVVAGGVAPETSHPYLNCITILKAVIKRRGVLRNRHDGLRKAPKAKM